MIVIQPRPGESVADVLRLALDLVDDRTAVRTGGGGVVVSEEVAWDYLCVVLDRIPEPPAPREAAPVPPTPQQDAGAPADTDQEPAAPAPEAADVPPGDGTSAGADAPEPAAAPERRPRKSTRAREAR